MFHSPLIIFFVATLNILSGGFDWLGIDEMIPFRGRSFSDEEWALVLDYLNEDGVSGAQMSVARVNEISMTDAERVIRRYHTFVGKFDLNDDGIDELFLGVFQSYYCGTIGCNVLIFKRSGPKEWRFMSSMLTYDNGQDRSWPTRICATVERRGGWRTLYSSADILLFRSGTEYVDTCPPSCGFCGPPCGSKGQVENMSDRAQEIDEENDEEMQRRFPCWKNPFRWLRFILERPFYILGRFGLLG